MRVLLIGNHGREHALAWTLHRSPHLEALHTAPGNPGTAQLGTNVDLDWRNTQAVVDYCRKERIELLIVGPEAPLVHGLCDRLAEALPELKLVGPGQAGAQLEGSKAFAKSFMAEFGIPTAAYRSFSAAEREAALDYLTTLNAPYVLKADGLAGGKGVVIAEDLATARTELGDLLDGRFGAASERVVIEQFLQGPEFSVFVLTDGKDYQVLPVARDYKRVGEGDRGPNTGGMGAISPVPYVDKHVMAAVREQIVEPTLTGLQERGIPYRGIIFLGLILVDGAPYVIEYNCRLGDPETQVVLPRLRSDLLQHFASLFDGSLRDTPLEIDARATSTLVLASGGYPGPIATGRSISGLDAVTESIPFFAGVAEQDGELKTSGGRVIALTSFGLTGAEAAETSRRSAAHIHFEGMFYRSDIGL